MKPTQHTQPNSSTVFAIFSCKSRLTAKILPAFLAALFAILSAAPSHAATPTQPLVAASANHSLFVKSDGTLWAMGGNSAGQLGDGTTTDRNSPVPVTTSTSVIAVAAGSYQSLLVTSDGKLWDMGSFSVPVATNVIAVAVGSGHCLYVTNDGKLWAMGYNQYGELGDGTTTDRSTPVPVTNSSGTQYTNVTAIAAGGNKSLFVTSDGKLWAMGNNNYGQLGDGTTTDRSTPVQVDTNVIAVAAGMYHSLYVKSDGTLWAMGRNQSGQLGIGFNDNNAHPTPVQVAANVIALAAGVEHSLFVTSDSKLWAMGFNQYGQLGDSTIDIYCSPVQVATNVIAVAAGDYHSLYVTSDGKLWAMGFNSSGQLGDGSTTNRSTPVPAAIGLADAPTITITFNAQGGTVSPATQTATQNYTYGTTLPTPTRTGYTFLGWWTGPNGTSTQITATTIVPVTNQNLYANWTPYKPPTPTLPLVAAGMAHSLYVTSDGKLWAMGNNYYGQLGDGTTTSRSTPVRVSTSTNVIAVAAGDMHSLYVTSDSKLWAMGFNRYGQLGIGFSDLNAHPTPVQVATNVIAVAAGGGRFIEDLIGPYVFGGSSLYVTSDGKLWAMGDNECGQLGDGTTTSRTTPVQVATNVIAVAAGCGHSLYVTSDGKLWAMGDNECGQLGDGTTTSRTTPVQVAANVIAVAAGYGHSLYVTSDGKLWAMGNNEYGQLGDGSNTNRTSPVQVAANVIAVAADGSYSLYVTSDGKLWAMGANGSC